MVLEQVSQFKIDKGIPIPPKKARWRPSKYPFVNMQVGDSFFTNGTAASLRSATFTYSKRTNTKFVTRSEGTGWRVWRVE